MHSESCSGSSIQQGMQEGTFEILLKQGLSHCSRANKINVFLGFWIKAKAGVVGDFSPHLLHPGILMLPMQIRQVSLPFEPCLDGTETKASIL